MRPEPTNETYPKIPLPFPSQLVNQHMVTASSLATPHIADNIQIYVSSIGTHLTSSIEALSMPHMETALNEVIQFLEKATAVSICFDDGGDESLIDIDISIAWFLEQARWLREVQHMEQRKESLSTRRTRFQKSFSEWYTRFLESTESVRAKGHLNFLNDYITPTPFEIRTAHGCTESELLAELKNKGFPAWGVAMVEKLDSTWHVAVRQSCVAMFRQIISDNVREPGDLEVEPVENDRLKKQPSIDDLDTLIVSLALGPKQQPNAPAQPSEFTPHHTDNIQNYVSSIHIHLTGVNCSIRALATSCNTETLDDIIQCLKKANAVSILFDDESLIGIDTSIAGLLGQAQWLLIVYKSNTERPRESLPVRITRLKDSFSEWYTGFLKLVPP